MENRVMKTLLKPRFKSWVALLAVAAVAIVVSAALSRVHAQMQDDEARPEVAALTSYAEFQYATLTGTTNTINASLVPIVTPSGTVYKEITFQVNVSSSGAVTIVSGSPTSVNSSTTQAAGFKAGTYIGPHFGSNTQYNGMQITVSGPGVVGGGYTDWSLQAASGSTASCQYPVSATWYVGSPTSTNNPLYARLKKAGVTSTAYSYGTLGSSSCQPNGFWYPGTLIGVSQTGNAITVASFTSDGGDGTDYSNPVDQITYTLK
jgi:hypothetical protein